jgi:hydroxymethylpyrimidine/phosphomethylpyrimidine kinase
MTPIALTIAGSDPSGGAGIQADLKTFHQFGVYGTSVISLLTVQNTLGVSAVQPLPASIVLAQLNAVLEDLPPQAVKTGALGTAEIVELVAERADRLPFLVVDPVIMSKKGKPLLDEDGTVALIQKLLPRAYLVTPNVQEAALIVGRELTNVTALKEAARMIADLGPKAVLVKGGHLGAEATDVLYYNRTLDALPAPRIQSQHTHGTGCTYSAAITALLAQGVELTEAVHTAKRYITRAIETSPGLGQGCGPINHFATP